MTNEFDIIQHPMFQMWLSDLATRDPLCVSFLIKGNMDSFEAIWGKPSEIVNRDHCWRKEYLGTKFFVYSNDQSTYYKVEYLGSYEMFLEDKRMGSYITGFMNSLLKAFGETSATEND